MFDGFFNPSMPFVAIDLADRSVKVARARKKRKGSEILAVGRVDLPEGLLYEGKVQNSTALAETLKSFFRSPEGKRVYARGVAMTLPEEHCFVRISHVPNLPASELSKAIRFEAESVIPLPPAEAVISWEVLGTSAKAGHLEVLIAGVPREIATSYADLLRAIQMVPVAFEPESFAIARALVGDLDIMPTLIIDLGHEHTGVIITEARRVRMTANVPIAARAFTERISEARKIKLEDAEDIKRKYGIAPDGEGPNNRKVLEPILDDLTKQVHDFFSYFTTHSPDDIETKRPRKIGKVVLTGGDAMLKGLPGYLSEGLGVPVEIGNPFRGITAKKGIIRHPLYTTAIGLSLYNLDMTEL